MPMTMKMYHCITVTVLTATAGKTVKVGQKNSHLSNAFCIVSAHVLITVVLGWLIGKDMSSLPSSYLQQNCLL